MEWQSNFLPSASYIYATRLRFRSFGPSTSLDMVVEMGDKVFDGDK